MSHVCAQTSNSGDWY